MLKPTLITVMVLGAAMIPVGANAHGCVKGAAVGAVAGHVAGHHAVAGAVVGCAVGHHQAKVKERQAAQLKAGAVKPGAAPSN